MNLKLVKTGNILDEYVRRRKNVFFVNLVTRSSAFHFMFEFSPIFRVYKKWGTFFTLVLSEHLKVWGQIF